MFVNPQFRTKSAQAQPNVCLSVRAVNLQRSPLSSNLEFLDETFKGADKMTSNEEKQTLRDNFYDAEFEDVLDGSFIMRTTSGLRYRTGHARVQVYSQLFHALWQWAQRCSQQLWFSPTVALPNWIQAMRFKLQRSILYLFVIHCDFIFFIL